ncbi:hypothetical protein [Methanobrevibacter filiformis]|uniref:Lipoprotein n=1 Tax=Methanobrevibacter filiformis TaxID=55758 RepID=A0A166D9Y7_9EURY|nr:hypothetical protein [Methanobrevibacter filiformis]KZX15359.1 hypothetical protein MBFIL_06600 [Methanobrevibacter filiformis]
MNSKNEGKLVLFLIIGLVAFGCGSGIGISMGISGVDAHNDVVELNTTENVTQEILSNDAPNNEEILANFDTNETVINNSSNNSYESKNYSQYRSNNEFDY